MKPKCRATEQGRGAVCKVRESAGPSEPAVYTRELGKHRGPETSFTSGHEGRRVLPSEVQEAAEDAALPRAARNSWHPGRRQSCTLMETWMGAEAKSCSFSPACSWTSTWWS